MKIAISGPANSGKTTILKEFLNTWKMYKTPAESYRDILREKNMGHSKKTSEETQKFILDYMVEQLEKNKDEQYIIYDRCPLDVLVYTVQAAEEGLVSEDFVVSTIRKVRDSLHLLDIIFIAPFDSKIKIINNNIRETDIDYIKKTDCIFQNLLHQYRTEFEDNIFFPTEDCPGIIELETLNRLSEIKTILNSNGDLYSPEDDVKLQEMFAKSINEAKNGRKMLEKLIESESTLSEVDKKIIKKLKL